MSFISKLLRQFPSAAHNSSNLYVREGSSIEKRGEVMREWYRSELKTTLPPIIEKWEEILKAKANHWEVKQMKTLLGKLQP